MRGDDVSCRCDAASEACRSSGGARKPDAEERSDLAAPAPGVAVPAGKALAVVAGGCFWSVELAYQREPGVTRTAVGYCQGARLALLLRCFSATHARAPSRAGTTPNPTYEATCSGRTGHTEAVLVEYDPAAVSYDRLCDVLWSKIDATQANGQGGDIGSQYRTGIYYTDDAQRATAIASRAKEQAKLGRTVHTEVMPAMQWYDAEKYHQARYSFGFRGTGLRFVLTTTRLCFGRATWRREAASAARSRRTRAARTPSAATGKLRRMAGTRRGSTQRVVCRVVQRNL